jgi:hypothetical protein
MLENYEVLLDIITYFSIIRPLHPGRRSAAKNIAGGELHGPEAA